jgi:hypothetical protein
MLSPRQIFEDNTVNRRNDIVHRADREKKNLEGPPQEISYAWAKQAVDTISVVCLCLDELVATRVGELQQAAAVQLQGA